MLIALLLLRVGNWMTSLPLRGAPWHVGSALTQHASPQTFDNMAGLYKASGNEEIATCEAAMKVRTQEPK